LTANGRLYQPSWSGGRAGSALTPVGGVASKRNPNATGAEVFPAPSVHVPLRVALPVSGPPYEADVQDAIPETGSELLHPIVRPWLYQPLASGPRSGTVVATGGVASYLIDNGGGVPALPALSVHPPDELAFFESGPE
jgi:hypothetical protein